MISMKPEGGRPNAAAEPLTSPSRPYADGPLPLPPKGRRGAHISQLRPLHRSAMSFAAIISAALTALCGMAVAETVPKRGGTLEFAVLVEPGNYDCHSNISFAFLHPVAPHYSTLLKFDAPITHRSSVIWRKIVERVRRPPHLHLQAAAQYPVSRRLEADLGRRQGELRAHRPPAAGRGVGAQGRLRRDFEHRYARPAHRRLPPAVAGGGDAGEFRLAMELHLQRRQARRGSRNFPRLIFSAPGRLFLPSTSRASIGAARAGRNISSQANPISTATAPIS